MKASPGHIRAIVEFFPLKPVDSPRGISLELFTDGADVASNRYRKGVKDDLLRSKGIYIYYDSRGRALYAGRTARQNLWKEMNLALNRSREVQQIRRVHHPISNVVYKRSDEQTRLIKWEQVTLADLATFFSAYEISPSNLIPMFEALIIRAFANDLLNVKMEKLV